MTGATLAALQRAGRDGLRAAGCATPDLDARLLLQHATGLSREALILRADEEVRAPVRARFEALIARRAAGVPVSRLMGRRAFFGLDLAIGPATLDPRPDTETLVEAVLARAGGGARPRILDLGTGSGAILIALLAALPGARGTGTDISAAALMVARANAQRAGLGGRAGFVLSDWAARGLPRADILVSNPPYIARGELPGLAREVRRHDPRRALDGGADGLAAYRAIARALPRLARPGALVALECGHTQTAAVTRILARAGAEVRGRGLGTVRDLAGRPRVVVARAPRAGTGRSRGEKGLGLRRASG